MHRLAALRVSFVIACLSRLQAQDSDIHDLQENLPVRVTDALASEGPQAQARALLSRQRPSGFQAQFEPQLQWGLAPGWHVQAAAVMLASSREENTNSGDVQVLVFRQLNELRGRRPAVAVSAGVDIASGIDSAGLDTRLRAILTQPLAASGSDRFHANFEWLRNAAKRQDERSVAWLATAGYSRVVGSKLVVIVDAARLQERGIGELVNLAEAGVRGRVAGGTVVSGGVSVGLGPNSPKMQFTVGVERSF